MKDNQIYFDYAAATPVLPEVFAVMEPYFVESFANPASLHGAGKLVAGKIETARSWIADTYGTEKSGVIFTGSATESINLALWGYMAARDFKGHIITTNTEHKAVLNTCKALEAKGVEVTYLPVNRDGIVEEKDLLAAIRPETCLASVHYVNNVTGVVQPLMRLFSLLGEKGVITHSDVTQAVVLFDCSLDVLNADMISFNGSKCYGPKGIGVLIKRVNVVLEPLLYGGGQEFGLRPGTSNVPGVLGFQEALSLVVGKKDIEKVKLEELKKMICDLVVGKNGIVLGEQVETSPHIVGVFFKDLDQEILMVKLDQAGFYVSAGAACDSGSYLRPDAVKAVVGDMKGAFIRLSLGVDTKEEDVRLLLDCLIELVD